MSGTAAGAPAPRRVTVVGAGALGCLYAARLSEAGVETWLLDHRAETVAALRRRGIVLHERERRRTVAVQASADPGAVPPSGLALLLVKSPALPAAAAATARLLAPDGWALPLQNGLGHAETVAAAVGPHRTLRGITYAGSVRVARGEIRPVEDGPLLFGAFEADARSRAVSADAPPAASAADTPPAAFAGVVAVLERAGLQPRVVADPGLAIWEKTAIACSLNPLTALLRVRLGGISASPSASALARELIAEAVAVAAAASVALDLDALLERQARLCAQMGDTVPSMLQDVLAGRPTEVEGHNGALVALADEHGVPVPAQRGVLALMRAVEQSGAQRVARSG
ncbi:ketopantoate reductase family protein [Conexibacter sp. CPCC 206217]|uniref:ketopantoate reductase family protein n=1 Tax=Conexibacter sp. CPCC 206217 TaxID=3064574 RepID=UPI0027185678|nr:2-dehydropantoate 2-reductase [Conexibacter sp. CPCC 206217]MDO8208887.1 2-dehydropantoate 2-reductase [Conexibacter sp. CPCC 206217]